MPTLKELKALTASGTEDVFSGTMRAFTGVQALNYWSSTTPSADPDIAQVVDLTNGVVGLGAKPVSFHVWPVRGP